MADEVSPETTRGAFLALTAEIDTAVHALLVAMAEVVKDVREAHEKAVRISTEQLTVGPMVGYWKNYVAGKFAWPERLQRAVQRVRHV